jgi:hypothetical protein
MISPTSRPLVIAAKALRSLETTRGDLSGLPHYSLVPRHEGAPLGAAWYVEHVVARPQKHIPASLEDALAELKRDPRQPVHARIDGLEVEIRVVEKSATLGAGLGDRMAAAGPWQGETEEEILAILRDARRAGGAEEPPSMP